MAEIAVSRTTEPAETRTVRWGAVIGGWLVACGIAFLFYIMGLAVGFSALDITEGDVPGKGVGIGTGIWLVLTWAVSLFLGAMFASWLDRSADPNVGMLHGIAVWALATTVSVLLAGLGFANLLQGGAALLKGGAMAAGAGAGAQSNGNGGRADGALGAFQAQARAQIAQSMARSGGKAVANPEELRRAMDRLDANAMASISADLARGNNERAKQRVAAESGLPQQEVDAVMKNLSVQAERYKAEAKEAADRAAKYTSAAMWAMFFSSLIALLAAAFGGWLGGGNVHRVYDVQPVVRTRTV